MQSQMSSRSGISQCGLCKLEQRLCSNSICSVLLAETSHNCTTQGNTCIYRKHLSTLYWQILLAYNLNEISQVHQTLPEEVRSGEAGPKLVAKRLLTQWCYSIINVACSHSLKMLWCNCQTNAVIWLVYLKFTIFPRPFCMGAYWKW